MENDKNQSIFVIKCQIFILKIDTLINKKNIPKKLHKFFKKPVQTQHLVL